MRMHIMLEENVVVPVVEAGLSLVEKCLIGGLVTTAAIAGYALYTGHKAQAAAVAAISGPQKELGKAPE